VLFFGRVFYLHQNRRWTALGYQEDNETSGLLTKTILAISMIFTITAWVIPYLNNKILQVTDQEIYNSKQKNLNLGRGSGIFFIP
jgi:hypothetical protein